MRKRKCLSLVRGALCRQSMAEGGESEPPQAPQLWRERTGSHRGKLSLMSIHKKDPGLRPGNHRRTPSTPEPVSFDLFQA